MSNLIDTQQALLEAIFSSVNTSDTKLFNKKGLEVYRANLRATALNALRITFPTIDALIGHELMSYATEKLLVFSPPSHGNWARWGALFPKVLKEIEALHSFPYLADCASLDYLCHQLVREANYTLDTDSLFLMQTHEPDKLKVELTPTFNLIRSNYPIVSIREIHKLPVNQRSNELGGILQNHTSDDEYFITCHRNDYIISVNSISAIEYQWYQLLEKYSLGEALELIDISVFSFENWLTTAIQNKLIYKISLY